MNKPFIYYLSLAWTISIIILSSCFSLILSHAQTKKYDQLIIQFRRLQTDFDGWGLHICGDIIEEVIWQESLQSCELDECGLS